jgi:hypothetical protein
MTELPWGSGKRAPETIHIGMRTTFMMAWNPCVESIGQATRNPSPVMLKPTRTKEAASAGRRWSGNETPANGARTQKNKAWPAASFRIPTATLGAETQSGKEMSGIRGVSRVMAVGGGQVIESAGSVVGAIAVSGAPGGEADDACAKAGIKAIADALEF